LPEVWALATLIIFPAVQDSYWDVAKEKQGNEKSLEDVSTSGYQQNL
jgi:hypothetical protein